MRNQRAHSLLELLTTLAIIAIIAAIAVVSLSWVIPWVKAKLSGLAFPQKLLK